MKEAKVTVKIMIKDALLKLMTEKPYAEISVTDIINKAGVARVSYYRNYKSIDEILDSIVDDKVEKLKSEIKPMIESSNSEQQWVEVLSKVFEHKYKMYANLTMEREMNRPYLESKMEARIQNIMSQERGQTMEEKYLFPAKFGIINGISEVWVNTGRTESVEQMAKMVYLLMKKLQ
ncbi:MAG: TetR family transcriptional regulator [Eubacteriales bacterium]